MIEELKIKTGSGSNAKDYVYTAKEVAEYHGVSETAVRNSRAYSKPQKQKATRTKGKFITDKLDKLYAYSRAEKMWIDGVVTGNKEEVIEALGENLEDEKKYKVITKEMK